MSPKDEETRPSWQPLSGAPSNIRYTVLPHAADFAMEVQAPDLPGLVEACLLAASDAAWGLDSLVASEKACFDVPPGDPEMQVFLAMSEALFLQDARDLLAADAKVSALADGGLRVELSCDRLDPGRHRPRARFKAVTLHGMDVVHTGDGLSVRVVLDV